jgi:hypothetical protein
MTTYTTTYTISSTFFLNNTTQTDLWQKQVVEKSTSDHTIEILLIAAGVIIVVSYFEYKRRIHRDIKEMTIRNSKIMSL